MLGAVLTGLAADKMDALSGAMMQSAKTAVELAIGLLGPLCLWLGLTRIVERAGLLDQLARALQRPMKRLFPSIPKDHPALGAIIMNFSANVLGMDNAATAFGLRAMRALNTLDITPGVASNAMIMFLAINTAGIAAFPVNVVAARAAIDPATAGHIIAPTIVVSIVSMVVAILWVKLLERVRWFEPRGVVSAPVLTPAEVEEDKREPTPLAPSKRTWVAVLLASVAFIALLTFRLGSNMMAGTPILQVLRSASGWAFPLLAAAMLLYGAARGVKPYEAAVEGARQGIEVFVRILPYLVIVLVAVGMLRASLAMDYLTAFIAPIAGPLGFPSAVVPQALVRPLSGTAAMGVLVDILKTHGPNSPEGFISSVIYGSSETTFYVISVYFGAVSVRSLRHALVACLLSDISGMFIAVWVSRLFL